MEKVSEKQGSSTVDISIRMMTASFRHHNRAPAVAANRKMDKYSIFTVHFLVCRVMDLDLHYWRTAQHHKQLAILMPTKQVTAEKEHHSTAQMIRRRVCPGRTNLNLKPTEHGSWITEREAKYAVRRAGPVSLVMNQLMTRTPQTGRARYTIYWWVWKKSESYQEAVAPVPSPGRTLRLENEDENREDTYVIFPGEALGTQRASCLSCFSSATQTAWRNALSLALVNCSSKLYKTNQLITNQQPGSRCFLSTLSTKHTRRKHLIFSLHLLISRH